MGGKDHCCVINCTSGRRKARNNAEQLSFFSFPMGNGNKAKHRQVLWLGAVRRKNFVPTKNSKVCGLHFVSGIAINNPESVDYVPSVNVGYEKHVSARETQTSKRAKYWSNSDLAASLDRHGRRQVSGIVTPDIGSEVTLGSLEEPLGVSLPVPEVCPEDYRSGVDHLYARPAVALATTHAAECQTEDIDSITLIKALEVTNQQQAATVLRLESEISKLKEELRILSFSADSLLPSDEAVQFYTGFTNRRVYEQVFQYIASKAENMHYWRGEGKDYDKAKTNKGKQRSTSKEVEFLGVLVHLKVGLFTHDIAARMQISTSQFTRTFTSWIRLLRLELEATCRFPTRHEVRHFFPPACMKYKNLRALIDCTEFFVETPSSLTAQRETWSSYKSHNTLKVLVACTPDRVLCYISRVYGGAASDKFITTDCGFLEHLQKGDQIMADKGFDIHDKVEKRGAALNLPPFRNPGKTQFEEDEVEKTKRIAEVRIHVERLIGRIKCYHILDGNLSRSLHYLAEDIIHTCAYLTQFQSPIIAQLNQDHPATSISGNTVDRGTQETHVSTNAQSSL